MPNVPFNDVPFNCSEGTGSIEGFIEVSGSDAIVNSTITLENCTIDLSHLGSKCGVFPVATFNGTMDVSGTVSDISFFLNTLDADITATDLRATVDDETFSVDIDGVNLIGDNIDGGTIGGNFVHSEYWNSSELNAYDAREQVFSGGGYQSSPHKTHTSYIRCVRTF